MPYPYPNAVIQVFCKAPLAGTVKTRLMPQLSAEQAADVHRRLALRTLELVCTAPLCPVQLWCTPAVDHPFFTEAAENYALTLLTQSNGDLGERMDAALSAGIRQFGHALLIGCDCPSLSRDDLTEALAALTGRHDVVLAPAEDGGYCLIGLKQGRPALFQNIDWGSSEVLSRTRSKISALALRCHELQTQWDVDNYTDYLRFLAQ